MDLKCNSCKASIFKSYGNTHKLRSRSIRWDTLNDTAVVQCNMCRSFNDLPLELEVTPEKLVIRVTAHIKKSVQKEKLIVKTEKPAKCPYCTKIASPGQPCPHGYSKIAQSKV